MGRDAGPVTFDHLRELLVGLEPLPLERVAPVLEEAHGAKGFIHGLSPGQVLLETRSLVVRSVAAPQLLAMKLGAWRDDLDVADARLLLSKIAGDRDSVWLQVEPHLVPGRELKARYAFDDIWEADRETE